jgi:predicted transcriptional regulator
MFGEILTYVVTLVLANEALNALIGTSFAATLCSLYWYRNKPRRGIIVRLGYSIDRHTLFAYYASNSLLPGTMILLIAVFVSLPGLASRFVRLAGIFAVSTPPSPLLVIGGSSANLLALIADYLLAVASFAFSSTFSSMANVPAVLLLPTIFVSCLYIRIGYVAFRNIRDARTISKVPRQYNPLSFVGRGRVFLGAEVARWADAQRTLRLGTRLPDETKKVRTLEKIGEDRPYFIDLHHREWCTNPHGAVIGTSGSGKSTTLQALVLREWLVNKTPFLILDWTGEHAKFARNIGGVVLSVPKPLSNEDTGFRINLFCLERGVGPIQRATEVAEALYDTTEISALMMDEVKKEIISLYEVRDGITQGNETSWANPVTFSYDDLILRIRAKLEGEYSREKRAAWSFLPNRLELLRGLVGEEPVDFYNLILRLPVCVNLEALSDHEKNFVTYLIGKRLEHMMRDMSLLRLIVVLDEAHLSLKIKQKEGLGEFEPVFVRILRMGRKYGFALIVSTQSPMDMDEKTRLLLGWLIAHRIVEPKTVRYVKQFTNLSETETELYVNMPIGAAMIRASEPTPRLVKVQMLTEPEKRLARLDIQTIRAREPLIRSKSEEKECRRCHRKMESGLKFCTNCGEPLHEKSGEAKPRLGVPAEVERDLLAGAKQVQDGRFAEAIVTAATVMQSMLKRLCNSLQIKTDDKSTLPELIDALRARGVELPLLKEVERVNEVRTQMLNTMLGEQASVRRDEAVRALQTTLLFARVLTAAPPRPKPLTQSEHKILTLLSTDVLTVEEIAKSTGIHARDVLSTLEGLMPRGLVKTEKVANLEGTGGANYYTALDASRLHAESIEHRAIVKQAREWLLSEEIDVIAYRQTADPATPDLGLRRLGLCVEVETGRKREQENVLLQDLSGKLERARRLGYGRMLVAVPNAAVERIFKRVAAAVGCEVTTIGRFKQSIAGQRSA